MSFVEEASARILKTLLSIFFLRRTITGRQISNAAMVRSAHRFALALDAQKTDNNSQNQMAVQIAEGLLIAFYQNRPANKQWSGLVHGRKTAHFVASAYELAAMLSAQVSTPGPDGDRPS